MIASNLRDCARRSASSGISNAPGTRYKSTFPSFAPNRLRAVERAFDQPRRDQFIPAAGDDCKAKGFSVKTSFVNSRLQAIRLRELNSQYVLQYRRCFEAHQVDEFGIAVRSILVIVITISLDKSVVNSTVKSYRM